MTTPRTIHFWQARKTARIGSTLTTAAAVTRLYSMKYMLVKLTRPSVTTFIVGEFTTMSGQNSTFHVHMNFTITRVEMAGFNSGRSINQTSLDSTSPELTPEYT